MPVPGGAVHHDLAQLDATQEDECQHCRSQGRNAEKQVQTVCAGDEVEKVAARVAGEEDALVNQLLPGDPLAGEEKSAQDGRCRKPGGSAADGRAA